MTYIGYSTIRVSGAVDALDDMLRAMNSTCDEGEPGVRQFDLGFEDWESPNSFDLISSTIDRVSHDTARLTVRQYGGCVADAYVAELGRRWPSLTFGAMFQYEDCDMYSWGMVIAGGEVLHRAAFDGVHVFQANVQGHQQEVRFVLWNAARWAIDEATTGTPGRAGAVFNSGQPIGGGWLASARHDIQAVFHPDRFAVIATGNDRYVVLVGVDSRGLFRRAEFTSRAILMSKFPALEGWAPLPATSATNGMRSDNGQPAAA